MIAAATDIPIGGLLCRTGDAQIASCLESLVSRGFCPGADAAATRTIAWEPSKRTPDWNRAGTLVSTRQASSRRWGNVSGFLLDDRPFFHVSDDACCWIAARDRVCVHGTPAPDNPDWMELLAVVVFELLAGTGHVAMHAGVVTLDGCGFVIVGPSGSGKSTLVYVLTQAGASYTTDDLTLISGREDCWFARSTGEQLRLRPGLTVDEALVQNDGLDALGKLRLRPRRPAAFRPVTRVERLVFLDPSHGAETTWRSMSRQEVVEGLMSEVALALSPAVAGQQLVSLRGISQLPAVTLRAGEDLMGQPDRAASVFRKMWAGSRNHG